MAKVNPQDIEAARQENLQATVSKTDQFFKENAKLLWTVAGVAAVVILAIVGYVKFIYQPKCAEAMESCYPADQAFAAGEFELALNGDGNVLGYEAVIDEYGKKAGKAVYFAAGVCELQLGNYEEALSYLKKYNVKEPVLAAKALGCQGDAFVGLENYDAAVACFEKAASVDDNMLAAAYLVKAGAVYEKLGKAAKAVDCYKKVKDQYPQSIEAYDIDKYITRAEAE